MPAYRNRGKWSACLLIAIVAKVAFGWHAPFNQTWLCRGLGNPILTRTTRLLGAARDQHTKLRWHDVQTLGDIFANNVTFAAAVTDDAVWCNNLFDAR